ncbi:hypothetical protein BVRB_4g091510 [Beta vulgaris subsp. vulgaris]|nr:hypothetical protein BVRB_4g091510 [Beta vulgaris subsp. vulgaris]
MTPSHGSAGDSSNSWGGLMRNCKCGVPCAIQTVAKKSGNHRRKFRGCGMFLEADRGYFQWLYNYELPKCSECSGYLAADNTSQIPYARLCISKLMSRLQLADSTSFTKKNEMH